MRSDDPAPRRPTSTECFGLAAPARPPAKPASSRSLAGGLLALLLAGLAGIGLSASVSGRAATPAPAATLVPAAAPTTTPAPARPPTLEALLDAATYDPATSRYVATIPDSPRQTLTLVPELQRSVEKLLATWRPAHAEVVALDPKTGAILAWVRETGTDPAATGLPDGAFPAASVFKLVTASALLDRGVSAGETVCYHGGKHRLHPRQLLDDDRRDRRCLSLADAIARSANAAIAKLALRNLDPVRLRAWAGRLLFNQPLPVAGGAKLPEVSTCEVPEDPFDFAATAAGFGKVTLTPLHGAALAAAIGEDGLLAPPHLVASGTTSVSERVWPADIARELTAMMEETVRAGTAHKAFRSRAARNLAAAGKTGSIATHGPFRDYSWFVGFAPALAPRIAIAAVVVNGQRWRVHASQLASSALQTYLHPPRVKPLTASR